MPKEFIYDQDLADYDDISDTYQVRVGWSKETGAVQIATLSDLKVPVERAKGVVDGNGFYVNLNRQGINDLIRVLRKARDQAYGKDE